MPPWPSAAVSSPPSQSGCCEHRHDLQPVLLRELEVALVVRGHAHHGARAVRRQHVVGDPDRHALAVERVGDVGAGEDARLLALRRHALDLGLAARRLDVRAHGVALLRRRDLLDQRMLRRQHEERHAVHRVRPRREDADLLRLDARARRARSAAPRLRSADPVALHRRDLVGPLELREVEQLLGVARDAEEPLLQVALRDDGVAALALAVDDLLVRQHRLVLRAPPDGRPLLVRQVVLQQLQEPPLRPLVVVRRRGDRLRGSSRTSRPSTSAGRACARCSRTSTPPDGVRS